MREGEEGELRPGGGDGQGQRRARIQASGTLQALQAKRIDIGRVQSCVLRLPKYWPPTPLSTRQVCPPPATKAEGTHSPGGEGGGGVNILEDERHRIGLLQ